MQVHYAILIVCIRVLGFEWDARPYSQNRCIGGPHDFEALLFCFWGGIILLAYFIQHSRSSVHTFGALHRYVCSVALIIFMTISSYELTKKNCTKTNNNYHLCSHSKHALLLFYIGCLLLDVCLLFFILTVFFCFFFLVL